MPKVKIGDYDATAANNTDINSIDIDEGWAPSVVNNAFRELLSQMADAYARDQAWDSITTGITAGTTQSQAGSTELTTTLNNVTVSGTNGDGVKLPPAVAGLLCYIKNSDSAQTIQIWPNTSDTVDGGSANAVDANALSAGAVRLYMAVDGTDWVTIINTAGGLASGDVIPADDGSVGAPGLSFADDADNGWYRIGANNWAGATAGAKVMEFDATGAILMPLQPNVIVQAATQTNVTGNNTNYTMLWTGTEERDAGGDFASSTFTAPVSGTYSFKYVIALTGLTAAGTRVIATILASNRTATLSRFDPWAISSNDTPAGQIIWTVSHSMFMDAADTVTGPQLTVKGEASDVVDISTNAWAIIRLVS